MGNYLGEGSYRGGLSRSKKGFEVVDGGAVVESHWNIPQAEAERIFGTAGVVPEGTIVVPYTVGATITGTTCSRTAEAGDLQIVTSAYTAFWGVTLTQVRSFGAKDNRVDYPEAVGYGERVAVATGHFDAVIQNYSTAGQSIVPGKKMFCGLSGQATIDAGGIASSGYVFAKIIEEGFIPYDVRTGAQLAAVSGGVADEILIKVYADQP